jgi:hypothetical protein
MVVVFFALTGNPLLSSFFQFPVDACPGKLAAKHITCYYRLAELQGIYV